MCKCIPTTFQDNAGANVVFFPLDRIDNTRANSPTIFFPSTLGCPKCGEL